MARIRGLLLLEAAAFAVSALVHFGVVIHGYEHDDARLAESVISLILFLGFLVTWIRPAWIRATSVVAQGLALVGTLIGVFTIIVGVGPRTAPDIIYHVGILTVLARGIGTTVWTSPIDQLGTAT